MPPKKRKAPKRRKVQNGEGFFDVLKKGFNFVKDNKLLSKGLSLVPHPGAQRVGAIAGQLGLGKGRPKKRRATKNVVLTN